MKGNAVNTVDAITELVFLEAAPKQPDLIFVFGNEWIQTMEVVASMSKEHPNLPILITGNSAKGGADKSEAEMFYNEGINQGISPNNLILETNATNTKENVTESIPLIEQRVGWDNIKEITVFCKSFHTRRVNMTCRNFFPEGIAYTFVGMPDAREIYRSDWHSKMDSRTRVLAEVRRIGEYAEKGDLSIF